MIDGITTRYQPARGPPRRVRYEARTPEGFWRVTEEWTGCVWRATGREAVTRVHVEVGPAATEVVDIVDEPAAETVRGPEEATR